MMNQPARKAVDTDSVPQPSDPTPTDRISEIRRLLLDLMAQGPGPLEPRINALSILRELSDSEREAIQQIYQLCYEAFEREANEKKMWHYQRLLRSIVLQQTVAPAGVRRRPDPLFCLDPQMEFAVESENSAAAPNGLLEARPAPRSALVYDAVYPACLFASAVLVFVLTFTSDVVDPSKVSFTSPRGSRSVERAPQLTGIEWTQYEATELQLAEAAANEAAKGKAGLEPAAVAANNGKLKDTPKIETVSSAPAVAAPMAKPGAPIPPTSELPQTKGGDAGVMKAPARRSLGPSMAVPELEAQLEALKTKSAADAQD